MKFSRKWLYMILVGFMIFSILPQTSQGVVFYTDFMPVLGEGNDGEYVLVYKYDTISNEQVVDEDLKSRRCVSTPTEFQTVEADDTHVSEWDFTYEGRPIETNQTDTIYLDSKNYLFLATEDRFSDNLTFFVFVTEDNGINWGEVQWVYNTTVKMNMFLGFGVSYTATNIVVAYSYKINPAGTVKRTEVLKLSRTSLGFVSNSYSSEYYGDDFDLINENDVIYIASTYTGTGDQKYVRVTSTIDGITLQLSNIMLIPPYNLAEQFEPSIIAWNDGFFVVAHDLIEDIFDETQNITFTEYMLWGASFSSLSEPDSVSNHTVIKSVSDGYYRKSPSLSVYRNQIFLAFELGEGTRLGGGRPEIAFSFTANGNTWTDNYMGTFTIYFNPGILFAIATVGCFIIVLPVYLIISKTKKK